MLHCLGAVACRLSCEVNGYSPVFPPGEAHGQRSLVGYSPWDHTEADTTKVFSSCHKWGLLSSFGGAGYSWQWLLCRKAQAVGVRAL